MRVGYLVAMVLGAVSVKGVSAQAPTQGEGYRLEAGAFEAGEIEGITLHDAARKKDLRCTVRYPKSDRSAEEGLAMIVFSHGAGGDERAFGELSAHWASLGYVVVHPTHSDSVRLRKEQGEDIPNLRKEMGAIVSKVDMPDRVADVRFVLDSIGKIEEATGVRVDRERLGMAGHSAGALTTQVIAGAKVRGARQFGGKGTILSVSSAGDVRIKAALVISGQGVSRMLTKESWDELALPMLVITGSKDTSAVSVETPLTRRMPYDLAKPGDKYLLFIEGATHSSYGGRQSPGLRAVLGEEAPENLEMIMNATSSATTAFWDAYLRSDENAKRYLTSGELSDFTEGKAVLEGK